MHHQSQPQFFLSLETDCPYLPGKKERKLFTTLTGKTAQLMQNSLSQIGFRRSQNIVYKPTCADCGGCLSARIVAASHQLRSSQKKVLSKNKDIVREIRHCRGTEEQYELFSRYVSSRHVDGGMSDMTVEEYGAMVEEPLVSARMIEYRVLENGRPGPLIACCLTDVIEDGVSMVYSFFDPDQAWRSLGTFMILDHIDLAMAANLRNVYLGYWVKGSPSMDYKKKFAPLELYLDNQWQHFDDPMQSQSQPQDAQKVLLRAHRALSMRQRNSIER